MQNLLTRMHRDCVSRDRQATSVGIAVRLQCLRVKNLQRCPTQAVTETSEIPSVDHGIDSATVYIVPVSSGIVVAYGGHHYSEVAHLLANCRTIGPGVLRAA